MVTRRLEHDAGSFSFENALTRLFGDGRIGIRLTMKGSGNVRMLFNN